MVRTATLLYSRPKQIRLNILTRPIKIAQTIQSSLYTLRRYEMRLNDDFKRQ